MKVTKSAPVLVHAFTGAALTGDEHYYLSNLDQNVAILMKTVYVFSPSVDRGDAGDAAKVIKDALARVLVHYYPFEGSLVVGPDGRFAVRNDRRGVPFVEAAADGVLSELGDLWVPGHAVGELVFADPDESVLEAPLLTVQVTRFACGCFVLGLALNHCLADGFAIVEFLRSWGEAARGQPLSTPPFLDCAVLSPRPRAAIGFAHDEFAEMEDVSGLAALYSREPCVHRAFHIDAGKLARLKQATAASSSFVALTALVWRARTRALRMRPEQNSKLLFAVDGRRRLDPPLPAGYWGNVVVFGCCVSTAGDLLGRPLSTAARSIQSAIERTDDAFIRSVVDYIEVTRARPTWKATMLVTGWSHFGFCAADFGWGQAVHFGPAELPEPQNELAIFQRNARDNTIVVILRLPGSCMQTFHDMLRLGLVQFS